MAICSGLIAGLLFIPITCKAQSCGNEESCVVSMEKRAGAGEASAIMWLADYYAMGAGNDDEKAIFWLKKYVNVTGERSLLLGQLQLMSTESEERQEGLTSLNAMAADGDEFAALELAKFYKEDPVCSIHWYQVAAKLGNTQAMKASASALKKSDLRQDRLIAAAWYAVLSASSVPDSYAAKDAEKSANEIISTSEDDFRADAAKMASNLCKEIKGCNMERANQTITSAGSKPRL
jgi:TPR repeat protein